MKILEVAGSGTIGTKEMGPISTDIYYISKYLNEFGHQVTIFDVSASLPRELLSKEIQIVTSNAIPFQNLANKSITNMRENKIKKYYFVQRNNKIIKKNEMIFIEDMVEKLVIYDFDIIHFHWWETALFFSKIYNNYVYTSHTPNWCSPLLYKGFMGFIRKSILNIKIFQGIHEYNVIRNAKLTIALGNFLEQKVNSDNIVTIPNGIEVDNWIPESQTLCREILDISKDDFVLLYTGRISYIKGIHVLVKAIELLLNDIKNMKVIIIGSLSDQYGYDDEITSYAKMILEKSINLPIYFKGFISNKNDTFKKNISAADLFILPSLFENQGNSVLEALAMKLPVIASNTGGTESMINNDVGLVFESGDYKSLTSKILYLWKNPSILQSMKTKSRDHILNNYTWKKSVMNHVNEFNKILNL